MVGLREKLESTKVSGNAGPSHVNDVHALMVRNVFLSHEEEIVPATVTTTA